MIQDKTKRSKYRVLSPTFSVCCIYWARFQITSIPVLKLEVCRFVCPFRLHEYCTQSCGHLYVDLFEKKGACVSNITFYPSISYLRTPGREFWMLERASHPSPPFSLSPSFSLSPLPCMSVVQSFSDPLEQLQQRTWVLHWSLFIHYNSSNGKNSLIDLFFQDK